MIGYGLWCGLVPACLWIALTPLGRLFCGHIYATVGLVHQGCHYLSLNDMFDGNCLIKCWYMSADIYIDIGMSFIWKLYACDIIVQDT